MSFSCCGYVVSTQKRYILFHSLFCSLFLRILNSEIVCLSFVFILLKTTNEQENQFIHEYNKKSYTQQTMNETHFFFFETIHVLRCCRKFSQRLKTDRKFFCCFFKNLVSKFSKFLLRIFRTSQRTKIGNCL